jgi:hypothetical protein
MFLRRFCHHSIRRYTVDARPSPRIRPTLSTPHRKQSMAFMINNMTAASAEYEVGRDATTTAYPQQPLVSRPKTAVRTRDPIVPPSEASGGVPDPTPEYLSLASQLPAVLQYPRNILVIIDLNGTLLFRGNRHNPKSFVHRPYAREFLSYCINTFAVVIWSSARYENVHSMCQQIISPEDRKKVVAVKGREKFGLTPEDFVRRVQCYKRLDIVWNDPKIAAAHPLADQGRTWSQLDTVLVDDSLEKARSEPYNLIQVPDFEGNVTETGFVLPQVHEYLNECSQQANISAYMKANPFKINPQFTL